MNLEEQLKTAEVAASEASSMLLHIYGSILQKIAPEGIGEVADKSSHKLIDNILRKRSPFEVISEEADWKQTKGYYWLIDPLDGTNEFKQGIPSFAVCIALMKDDSPVIGVVYVPASHSHYTAIKGQGACLGGNRIYVSTTQNLETSSVLVSTNEMKDDRFRGIVENLPVNKYTAVGSTALKCVMLAEGEADINFTLRKIVKEWDTAAAHLIVTEAGGKITDCIGKDLGYNKIDPSHQCGIVVTNGPLHESFLRQIVPTLGSDLR
jgi:3'(2'), 5'-bisphosphate nucleotidase